MSEGLVLDGLTRDFGRTRAVDGLRFSVAPGEIFGLLGPNGSGKTTTLRLLSTLLRPSAGTANLFGHDLLRDGHRIRPLLGAVLQEPALDEDGSAESNVGLFLAMRGVRRSERAARVTEALQVTGLEDVRRQRAGDLSWGTKRRLEIARALSLRPRLLLLDEPTLGLDAASRRRALATLDTWRRQGDHIVFVCTHDPELMDYADRVAILENGRVRVVERADELRRRYRRNQVTIVPSAAPEGNAAAIVAWLEAMGLSASVVGDEVHVPAARSSDWIPRLLDHFSERIEGLSYEPMSLKDAMAQILVEDQREEARR